MSKQNVNILRGKQHDCLDLDGYFKYKVDKVPTLEVCLCKIINKDKKQYTQNKNYNHKKTEKVRHHMHKISPTRLLK